ncbi:hypothetical protein [Streptomyces virginiae]|uniref:hypothetical protein n=1 Tax=Streptomyces virginiae TaxID=1961 RepID=UPI0022553BB1|nr:hypothetical protein [Streptomyces virginiae]MCX5278100.1 hypothetical protein [Streptomyces virginiae]
MSDDIPKVSRTSISLPTELLEALSRRTEAKEIPSLSGHITSLLQREMQAAEVDATLKRLFPGGAPDSEHYAWAERALGNTAGADQSSAA